ncbi:hypothetical protein BJY52DRAFT_1297430 [Lactarius psammicola]|nr:hypothetical protein BJY52DRAFT_1297430 [Lactarius psammicola]
MGAHSQPTTSAQRLLVVVPMGMCFHFLVAVFLEPQIISTKRGCHPSSSGSFPWSVPRRPHAASPLNGRKGGQYSPSSLSSSTPSSA